MKLHLPQSLMALLLTAYACLGEQWSRPVYELTGNTITVSDNVAYPTVTVCDVVATASRTVKVTGNGTVSAPSDWGFWGCLCFFNASNDVLDSGVTFRNFMLYSEPRCDSIAMEGTYQACDIECPGTLNLSMATLASYGGTHCSVEF